MARHSQPRRRPPSAPSPFNPAAATPRARPLAASGARAAAAPAAMASAPENLDEAYAHVRRDLTRIIVLMVVLLSGIYASQFLF